MSGTMEHYPVLPVEATHVVSVNSRLALRDAPAYLASSNLASEDNHIKGEIIDMMSNGTRLIVLDYGVGYECEWAEVLVEGKTYPYKKMFTSTKFINAIDSSVEYAPSECTQKSWGNPSAMPLIDWTTKASTEVIFDEHAAKYKVCVEMSDEGYVSTGGGKILDRLREATVHGLRSILTYNGKEASDNYVNTLMTKTDGQWFQFVRASEYFVDTKPNSFLKVLVELPHRFVPPLEDAKGVVMTSAGRSQVAWNATENVKIRSTYNTQTFKQYCENLASLLEEYASDIDNYEGTVNDYDAREEAARIRRVPSVLTKLFKTNDITHDTWKVKETLEIGWDETLTPIFISLTLKDGRVIAMYTGMEEYADTPPIDSQRNQGYIWQLNLLYDNKRDDRPWTEFLNAFTLPEPPVIMPGAKGKQNPADISKPADPAEAEAAKTDASPVKTYADKLSEDRKLGDPSMKQKLYDARKDAFDFVGSSMASCEGLQKTLDKVDTLDDAFSEVLDKISIADLIKQCMEALTPELSSLPDVGGFDLDGLDIGSGIGIGDMPDVGLDYDWSMPNMPSANTNLQLSNLGSMSVGSLGLDSLDFNSLGLSGMSIDALKLGSLNIGSLGIGDLSAGSLGIGSMSVGELGIDLGDLGIGDLGFSDIDFEDFSVGDLSLNLDSLSIGDIGFGDMRIGNLGVDIGDLGLTIEDIESLDVDTTGIDTSDLTFSQLGLTDINIGDFPSLDFDGISMGSIDLSSYNIGDFDINLDSLSLRSLGDFNIGDLGLDAFSLSELGLGSLSVGDLGIANLDFGSLGLGNLDMNSLGLSGMDLGGLKGKLEDLGLEGALSQLEDLGLDKLGVDPESLENLSTEFTEEFDKAKKKLENMVGKVSAGENPFEQGTPKLIADIAITLADNLPTEDIMGSMAEAIEDALTMFLQELFVSMVKVVLEQMIENCGEDSTQAGKENLNDMLADSPNQTGQADPLIPLLAALGTGLSGDSAAVARDNPTSELARAAITPAVRKEVTDMLDDVSLMLTPMELCSLINGTASKKVVLLARNFIHKRYPSLNLKSRTKVADFFKSFGGLIDPSICRIIETPLVEGQGPVLGDVLCSTSEMRDLRKEMLQNKQDDITDEQIEIMLDKLRQRKVNAAKVLADIVNKGPLSDDYQPPPAVCQKNSSPQGGGASDPNNAVANNAPGMDSQGGLVDLTDPSIDFAIEIATNNLFDPVEIAFSRDMRDYPQTYTGDTNEEQTEPVSVWMDGEKTILNPSLQAQYGTKEMAEKVLADKIDDEGKVPLKSNVRRAMPALQDALKNMETNDALDFRNFDASHDVFKAQNVQGIDDNLPFENGGYGIELMLPKLGQNDIASISDALQQDGAPGDVTTLINEIMGALDTAQPTIQLYYIFPKLTVEQIEEGTYINSFLMVATQSVRGATTVVHRTLSTTSASEEILAHLEEDENYELHSTSTPSAAPARRFGSLVRNRWAEAGATGTQANNVYNEAVEDDDGGLYSEISRDIFAYISQKIANGPYFQNINATSGANDKSGSVKSSVPVVEYLVLDPEPTAQQQVDGVDVHPLQLQKKKECMRDNIKKNQCIDFARPTDGSPADSLSDTEQEMMDVCMQTIVQTYMIDHYLRGLYANSVFKMPSTPDEAYLNHVSSYILADIASYDMPNYVNLGTLDSPDLKPVSPAGTYQADFIEQAVQSYKKPDDMETTEEDPGGEISEIQAVSQMVENLYPTVMRQMESVVSVSSTADIKEIFIRDYLKKVTLSDYGKMESKFFKKVNKSKFEEGVLQGQTDYETDTTFQNLSLLTENLEDLASSSNNFSDYNTIYVNTDGGNSVIDYTNGNLYLESYYLLEDWDEEPDWWNDMDSTSLWSHRGFKFIKSGAKATPADQYKYFGVISEADYERLKDDLPDGVKMQPAGIFASGSVSKGAAKSVRRGIRIMYLPPTEEEGLIPVVINQTDREVEAASAAFANVEPTSSELFDAAWNAADTQRTGGNSFTKAAASVSKEIAVKTKAYRILEVIQEQADIKIGTATGGGETALAWSNTGRANAYLFKETCPIPIVDYNFRLSDHTTAVPTSTPSLSSGTDFDDVLPLLLASSEFKTLIEYIFPMSRMQSILSLYCFQAASSKQEVASAMSETKDKLRTVFYAVNSKGDYRQSDPALDAVGGQKGLEKMMANEFGVKDPPASENSWNYNMPVSWGKSAKGLGFEMVAKATGDALKRAFKKWAEKHDPNISLAHKLAIVTKMANVNIPTLAWSFMILPANIFPLLPIGPILGPVSIVYHALGLGLWKRVKGAEDKSSKEITDALEALGISDKEFDPGEAKDCDDNVTSTAPPQEGRGRSRSARLREQAVSDSIGDTSPYVD